MPRINLFAGYWMDMTDALNGPPAMSFKLVERAINDFLASRTPEVMCLIGKWGIGKTFSWKFFLKKAKDENRLALEKYSYVSLFGLSSVDQLKSAIFENSINSKDIGVEPSLASLKTNTLAVANSLGRRSLSLLEHLPWTRNFAAAVNVCHF
jgi:Cdc6-like AAA superfamily ATPase